MRLLIITRPDYFSGEAEAITALFQAGLETLHLRKPGTSASALRSLLDRIPAAFRQRIVTHECFELAKPYGLKGIHLNGRNPEPPAGFEGHISCSCHTLEEVKSRKADCGYVFLSPIYDSISKAGYASAFSTETLRQARQAGIIDDRVIALGGINESRLAEVRELGFGGAVVLGDVWGHLASGLVPHFLRLKRKTAPPVVLAIAGSDPSGGAGIQADIKTISALGGYAASAVTALTVQNTLGVQGVYPTPPQVVGEQVKAVLDDLPVCAVKIGMVPDAETAESIAGCLRQRPCPNVVYDPVMVSTSGRSLMSGTDMQASCRLLFPLCSVVTPNLHETARLTGRPLSTPGEMEHAARTLSERYGTSFLVKGGHLEGEQMCDVLYNKGTLTRFAQARVDSPNLHGTGCTLSSAVATELASGLPMEEAVDLAKSYVTQAIQTGKNQRLGQGNGPLWHFFQQHTY